MMLREKITKHINDLELKKLIYTIIDKAIRCSKNHINQETQFLNPYELKYTIEALKHFDELSFLKFGGYEQAERNVLIVYQSYMNELELESPISILKITGNFKFRKLSHKDYLGAILSLGIKREKIGDIIVNSENAYLIISKSIEDYIYLNLNKIASENIKIEVVDEVEFIEDEKYQDKEIIVSSMRMDTVISKTYNISRQESAKLIDSGNVKLNFAPVNSNSISLKEKDIISVRGKGRFIFEQINNKTKKDNYIISIKILK